MDNSVAEIKGTCRITRITSLELELSVDFPHIEKKKKKGAYESAPSVLKVQGNLGDDKGVVLANVERINPWPKEVLEAAMYLADTVAAFLANSLIREEDRKNQGAPPKDGKSQQSVSLE